MNQSLALVVDRVGFMVYGLEEYHSRESSSRSAASIGRTMASMRTSERAHRKPVIADLGSLMASIRISMGVCALVRCGNSLLP